MSSYLEANSPHRIEYIIRVLAHLGMFSRGILKVCLSTRYNIGTDIRYSLYYTGACVDTDM